MTQLKKKLMKGLSCIFLIAGVGLYVYTESCFRGSSMESGTAEQRMEPIPYGGHVEGRHTQGSAGEKQLPKVSGGVQERRVASVVGGLSNVEVVTRPGQKTNLGLFLSYPKGFGADLQVYRLGNFGAQVGVKYFVAEKKADPIVSLGYNLKDLTKVTQNTSLFVGYAFLNNTAIAGIRINL